MNQPRPRIVVSARDPVLRAQIIRRLADLGEPVAPEEAHDVRVEVEEDLAGLTPRESEVLPLLAEGLANKEIAARLGFSTHTAKFHVESILRKLRAANRAEAVREGIRRGLMGV